MKLLLCASCSDVVKFGPPMQWRHCVCGRSSARYLEDGHAAEIAGEDAHALGLDNHSVVRAVHAQRAGRKPPRLDGWLFERDYYRITHLPSPDASIHPITRRPLTRLDILEDACDEPFPLPDSF
jgi:hypothetical protein